MSEAERASRGAIRRIMTTLVWVVVAAVVLLALVRVFIRPVAPVQDPPPDHFGRPCVLCHIVTEDAEIIGYNE